MHTIRRIDAPHSAIFDSATDYTVNASYSLVIDFDTDNTHVVPHNEPTRKILTFTSDNQILAEGSDEIIGNIEWLRGKVIAKSEKFGIEVSCSQTSVEANLDVEVLFAKEYLKGFSVKLTPVVNDADKVLTINMPKPEDAKVTMHILKSREPKTPATTKHQSTNAYSFAELGTIWNNRLYDATGKVE